MSEPSQSSANPSSVASATESTSSNAINKPLTPLRCLIGAVIAGGMAFAMYLMMNAIALSFATHKIQSSNMIVLRLSAAVRTLVIGLVTMGTGVFGLAALGLTALAIQLIVQRPKQTP